MLLVKIAQEEELRKSRRVQDSATQEKSLKDMDAKWEAILNEKTNELMTTIQSLQEENKNLSVKLTQLELKGVRLQREIDEGDTEVFKVRC